MFLSSCTSYHFLLVTAGAGTHAQATPLTVGAGSTANTGSLLAQFKALIVIAVVLARMRWQRQSRKLKLEARHLASTLLITWLKA